MDSLSLLLSSSPLPKTHKFPNFKPFSVLSNHNPSHSPLQSPSSRQPQFSSTRKLRVSLHAPSPTSLQHVLWLSQSQNLAKSYFSFSIINLFTSFACLASETVASSLDSDAGKINLESILVSIDDFFNRYPFFVAGCTFIWLVVIPLTQEYFRKYKFISAIDAFRKLRDDPDSLLLDIRDRKNVKILGSPNLKILNKEVVQVEFSEGNEDGFVKKVLESFRDAPNTVVCILDSFDGNSIKVAELLFKNGFKEAYAIKGGVRGQQGWMAIQDTLLPPSVHINPRKKTKATKQLSANGGFQQNNINYESALSPEIPVSGNQKTDGGHVRRSAESIADMKNGSVASSSPYPNYPDMKPPSSPTPSKPQ